MSSLFLDVFVLFWGGEPAGKLPANDFLLRNVVIKNGLLTLAYALLTFCSRLLTLCSRFAHGLLTVCSRFARAAHALLMLCSRFGGLCVCLDEETHKQSISKPCHCFVVPSHVYLRHTAFRLQTPWGWFSNLKKKTPTCHSQPFAEAGLAHPCLSLRYVWYVCATFLLSPKDSESISYIMVLWHVPL